MENNNILTGSNISNIYSENQLANVIGYMNIDSILSILQSTVESPKTMTERLPNFVHSLDIHYNALLSDPNIELEMVERLKYDRLNKLNAIIDFIGNIFMVDIDKDNISYDNIFTLAYYLYEIFINYYKNTVNFFVSYILKNKSTIYDSYNLSEFKKNKDSSTIYNKKIYKNHKVAIIVSNLELVVKNISSLDISFEEYLYSISNNPSINQFLLNMISPDPNFFKKIIGLIYNNINTYQSLISDVRVQLSNATDVSNDINITKYIDEE